MKELNASKEEGLGSSVLTQLSFVNSAVGNPDVVAGLLQARRLKLNVREIRERLGMSQQKFAGQFGISIGTLRNWEQGVREPEGPARAYLTVIKNDPDAVIKALSVREPPD